LIRKAAVEKKKSEKTNKTLMFSADSISAFIPGEVLIPTAIYFIPPPE
jgi:hypothetical protein